MRTRPTRPGGFSLVEILVGFLVLACLIIPVYHMFSGSLKVKKASAALFDSVNLASSCMEALRALPPESYRSLSETIDTQAPSPFDLESLKITPTGERYIRSFSIEEGLDENGLRSFRIHVSVNEPGDPPEAAYEQWGVVVVKTP